MKLFNALNTVHSEMFHFRPPLSDAHANAHAKVKKWIFDVQFPGNFFEFGINLNDF